MISCSMYLQKAVTVNIVYMDKVIWQMEFGVMNNSETNKRKPTSNTIFPIASVSKVLTVRYETSQFFLFFILREKNSAFPLFLQMISDIKVILQLKDYWVFLFGSFLTCLVIEIRHDHDLKSFYYNYQNPSVCCLLVQIKGNVF